jgi:phosphoglycolate phosphatase
VAPAEAVYVGDSVTDCRAAEAAGMRMVAVTYGYNRGLDLTKEPCTAIIDRLDELLPLLGQN